MIGNWGFLGIKVRLVARTKNMTGMCRTYKLKEIFPKNNGTDWHKKLRSAFHWQGAKRAKIRDTRNVFIMICLGRAIQ